MTLLRPRPSNLWAWRLLVWSAVASLLLSSHTSDTNGDACTEGRCLSAALKIRRKSDGRTTVSISGRNGMVSRKLCSLRGGGTQVDELPDSGDNLVRKFPGYKWAQEPEEAYLYVPLGHNETSRHIKINHTDKHHVDVFVNGERRIGGKLFRPIQKFETAWEIIEFMGNRSLKVDLKKELEAIELFDWQYLFQNEIRLKDTTVTHQVYFDIKLGDEFLGQVVIGLYGKMCPKEVANFVKLANNQVEIPNKTQHAGYKNCSFHSIDFLAVYCGDVNGGGGDSGYSIYGRNFDVDQTVMDMEDNWNVCMQVIEGKMDSRFFFTGRKPVPWIAGRHVVIGRILAGKSALRSLYDAGSPGDQAWACRAYISNSGEILPHDLYWVQQPIKAISPEMFENMTLAEQIGEEKHGQDTDPNDKSGTDEASKQFENQLGYRPRIRFGDESKDPVYQARKKKVFPHGMEAAMQAFTGQLAKEVSTDEPDPSQPPALSNAKVVPLGVEPVEADDFMAT